MNVKRDKAYWGQVADDTISVINKVCKLPIDEIGNRIFLCNEFYYLNRFPGAERPSEKAFQEFFECKKLTFRDKVAEMNGNCRVDNTELGNVRLMALAMFLHYAKSKRNKK